MKFSKELVVAVIIFLCTLSIVLNNCTKEDPLEEVVIGVDTQMNDSLYVSLYLQKYLYEFKIDAFKRGLEVDDDINKYLKDIVLVDYLEYPMAGLFLRKDKIIYISVWTRMEVKLIRRVLYHELGHALTKPIVGITVHPCEDCGDIMATRLPESVSYLSDNKVWEAELDVLFKWIKANKRTD